MEEKIKKIIKDSEQIPFGNSAFQILNFISKDFSNERIYRKVLLQLTERYRGLQEARIRRKRLDIDLREIVNKKSKSSGFALERLKVDEEEKLMGLEYEDKLIKDALVEVELYIEIYEKLPKFSREEFEKSELEYWKDRLLSDAQMEMLGGRVEKGTQDSLKRIGIEIGTDRKIKITETTDDLLLKSGVILLEDK